jgi:hypothetical protein
MRRRIDRPMLRIGTGRICPEKVVIVPIRRRSDRSWDEPAATIWADVFQNAFDARSAEGTFIGADARLKRVRRQSLAAVLTGRPEFKHGILGSYR